jgi:hypothetical protein
MRCWKGVCVVSSSAFYKLAQKHKSVFQLSPPPKKGVIRFHDLYEPSSSTSNMHTLKLHKTPTHNNRNKSQRTKIPQGEKTK